MAKFKNKYRIESNRNRYWDYSNPGHYFITICTQNREHNLGKITDGKMQLTDFGEIVDKEWVKSFEIRDELFCDEYIIMPNHLHAILIIKNEIDPEQTHGRASLKTSHELKSPHELKSSNEIDPEQTHGRASQNIP